MTANKRLSLLGNYAIIIILGFVFILPFLYTLYTSVSTMQNVNKLAGISSWTLNNYKLYFTNDAYNVPKWLLNTIIMTGVVIIGNLIINPMAGFALAKVDFAGKKGHLLDCRSHDDGALPYDSDPGLRQYGPDRMA